MRFKVISQASLEWRACVVDVAGSALINLFLFQGSASHEAGMLAVNYGLESMSSRSDSPLAKTVYQAVSGLMLSASPLSTGMQAVSAGMWGQLPVITVFGALRYFGGSLCQSAYESLGGTGYSPWVRTFSNLLFKVITPISSFQSGGVMYQWAGVGESKMLVSPDSVRVKSRDKCQVSVMDGSQRLELDVCGKGHVDVREVKGRSLEFLYRKDGSDDAIPVVLTWDGQSRVEVSSSDSVLQTQIADSLRQTHSTTYPESYSHGDFYGQNYDVNVAAVSTVQTSQFEKNFPAWKRIHASMGPKATERMLGEIKTQDPMYYASLVQDKAKMSRLYRMGADMLVWQSLEMEGFSSVVLGARAMGSVMPAPVELVEFAEVYLHAFSGVITYPEGRFVGGVINRPVWEVIKNDFYPEMPFSEFIQKNSGATGSHTTSNEDRKFHRFAGALFGLPRSWVIGYEEFHDVLIQVSGLEPRVIDVIGYTKQSQGFLDVDALFKTIRERFPRLNSFSDDVIRSLIVNVGTLDEPWKPACVAREGVVDGLHSLSWHGRRPVASPTSDFFSDATARICDQIRKFLPKSMVLIMDKQLKAEGYKFKKE